MSEFDFPSEGSCDGDQDESNPTRRASLRVAMRAIEDEPKAQPKVVYMTYRQRRQEAVRRSLQDAAISTGAGETSKQQVKVRAHGVRQPRSVVRRSRSVCTRKRTRTPKAKARTRWEGYSLTPEEQDILSGTGKSYVPTAELPGKLAAIRRRRHREKYDRRKKAKGKYWMKNEAKCVQKPGGDRLVRHRVRRKAGAHGKTAIRKREAPAFIPYCWPCKRCNIRFSLRSQLRRHTAEGRCIVVSELARERAEQDAWAAGQERKACVPTGGGAQGSKPRPSVSKMSIAPTEAYTVCVETLAWISEIAEIAD